MDWVIMMCQYRFINCNKCITLVGAVDNGGGYACVGAEGIWETSVSYSQFCHDLKTALKIKSTKKNLKSPDVVFKVYSK